LLFDWVTNRSKSILSIATVFLIFCIGGLANLSITPDNRVFYGPNNTHFQQFLDFEARYTPNNNIIFVVNIGEPLSNPIQADAIRWLTARVWEIDNVIRVDSIANYPLITGVNDTISVTKLLDAICPIEAPCAPDLEDILRKDQLINRLVSKDLRSVGVVATLAIDIGSLGTIERISANANSAIREFKYLYPGYEIVMTGGVPMMSAFATSSEADLSILLPIALVIIVTLLFVFLGSMRPVLILVGLSLLAAACTLGIAGWLGFTINTATSIVPLVVFTLVVTSSMHLMLHFLRSSEGRNKREDIEAAIRASLEGNLSPIVVSAITSVIGLLSLSFVDSPPLQQLGWFSAIGVSIGVVSTLLIVPILLKKHQGKRISSAGTTIQRLLNIYARSLENQKSLAAPFFLILLLSLFGYFNLEINDDFVDYFDESTEFRIDTDRATQLLSGPNHIEVLLGSPEPSSVFDPEYVAYLDKLRLYLQTQHIVSSVSSYYDVLSDLSKAFLTPIGDVATADEFAQWYLAFELSLQRGQSSTDFISNDQHESRVSVLLKESTSKEIRQLESDIYDWHTNNGSQFSLLVTGENIPVAHISELNIRSLIGGLSTSILIVTLLVGLLVKRFRIGLVALVAALLPVIFGFGVWGLLGRDVGLASTLIIALTFGVVIDDAVHMLYRFVDGRDRLALRSWEAAAYSIHRAGNAITTTSIVMIGGLSVLLLSSFKVNSSFGATTCLIIALALIFDLFILPRLLIWADPDVGEIRSNLGQRS